MYPTRKEALNNLAWVIFMSVSFAAACAFLIWLVMHDV